MLLDPYSQSNSRTTALHKNSCWSIVIAEIVLATARRPNANHSYEQMALRIQPFIRKYHHPLVIIAASVSLSCRSLSLVANAQTLTNGETLLRKTSVLNTGRAAHPQLSLVHEAQVTDHGHKTPHKCEVITFVQKNNAIGPQSHTLQSEAFLYELLS